MSRALANCRGSDGSGEAMKILKGKIKSMAALLDSREDRVKLLKAGFSGKEIEAMYLILNSFENVGVNWQPAGA
jgi:hypothetical protein